MSVRITLQQKLATNLTYHLTNFSDIFKQFTTYKINTNTFYNYLKSLPDHCQNIFIHLLNHDITITKQNDPSSKELTLQEKLTYIQPLYTHIQQQFIPIFLQYKTLINAIKENNHITFLNEFSSELMHIKDEKGWSMIHHASSMKNSKILTFLLKNKANPNETTSTCNTPLEISTNYNRKTNIQILLSFNANPNIKNNHNRTPLHNAVQKSDSLGLPLILSKKTNLNTPTKSGNTALHIALITNHASSAYLLLTKGAKPTIQNYKKKRPISYISNKITPKLLETLILRGGYSKSISEKLKLTIASIIYQHNLHNALNHLIKIDPSILKKLKPNDNSLINSAIINKKYTIASILISHDIATYQTDPYKNNALHYAIACKEWNLIELLCKKYPDLLLKENIKGNCPLDNHSPKLNSIIKKIETKFKTEIKQEELKLNSQILNCTIC